MGGLYFLGCDYNQIAQFKMTDTLPHGMTDKVNTRFLEKIICNSLLVSVKMQVKNQ